MGRDKALLETGGETLAARVAGVVREAAGRCAIVAPAGRYEGLGVPVLIDVWPGEGPLGGILTALREEAAERNLIVAVDMPRLSREWLWRLLDVAAACEETVVPVRADGELEPLCAVYRAAARPALEAFFAAGGRRVKDALRSIPVRTVPAEEGILLNVNRPEEWEAVRG
jgi:molybdenum cofactor guanylyltransferase